MIKIQIRLILQQIKLIIEKRKMSVNNFPIQNKPINQSPITNTNHTKVMENTRNAYTKIISKVKHNQSQHKETNDKQTFKISNPNIIRGGLIGAAVSILISWNAGKYSRLGIFRKRWRFIRNFIMVNRKPSIPAVFTNYYTPPLNTVVKNFMCYSGQAGIGKSSHFMNLAYTQSGIRPAIYLSFKASGKDATFQQDMAQQAEYGSDYCPGILSQIIKAVKRIDHINKFPHRFWLKIFLTQIAFAGGAYALVMSSLQATYGIFIFGAMGLSYLYYLNFIYPLVIQSFRRTCPLIIFDDLNKIEHLNMLPQIVRYLTLLENNMANVILVSPDEDTWCKLRRQPGVKDRLRVRQIYYNHIYTAQSILKFINDDKNFEIYMKYFNGNKLYSKDIVTSLLKQLIGKRQVTLRRFASILTLNDEQQYEKLVSVLKECSDGKISTGETVQKFTDILYDSETRTMVANLKNIKRQVKTMTDDQFFLQLRLLLKKKKLPSDNQIAPHLKAYNIVRDLQSQYVFNGRFMFTVFNMAIQQYEKDMKQFAVNNESSTLNLQSQTKKSENILHDPIKAKIIEQKNLNDKQKINNENAIKNWNESNIAPNKQQVTKQSQSINLTMSGTSFQKKLQTKN